MSQPLRFVVEQLHVAVPPDDLLTVRRNLERAGLTLQDTPPASARARAGVVLHAERVVELDVSLERDSVKLVRLAKAWLSSTSLSTEEAVAGHLELAPPKSAGVYAAVMLDSVGPQADPSRTRTKRVKIWLKVFRVTVEDVIPTGYELAVYDEPDADRQLDLLASVAPLRRTETTIKPKPGWEAYGDPTVFGRSRPQQ